MGRNIRFATAVAMIFLCVACTSTYNTGKSFDAEAASGFVVGETTKDQAMSALGEPISISTQADGTETWFYAHSKIKSNGMEAIGAVYGLNEYSMDEQTSSLTLIFSDGILADMNSSQSSQ